MSEPWFNDPNLFGVLYGSIVGGSGGVLGGVIGALAGYNAPRGKGRRFVLGALAALILFGVSQSIVGLVAVAAGQPVAIWGPFLLCGVIFTLVAGVNYPNVRRTYDAAENRRLEAEALRNG